MQELKQPYLQNRFNGLFTLFDSALIPDGFLANSLNVSVADGSVAPFKQYSQFSTQLDTEGRILSSKTLKTSLGVDIPVRLRDDGSTCVLEWYNATDNDWDTLLAGLTTAKPMAFADYNTATQDGVFMCNGVMNYSFWKKSIGTVASNSATVITLNEASASTQGFSSGTVIVNGTEYAYSGVSGATLTGLTGLPTFDVNEGVAEAVDDSTYTGQPKFDMMVVADGRVWGAISTNVRLYYSQVGVGTNFTTSTSPDDPGLRDFIEGEGAITGLGAIKENIIVFKKDLVRLYKLDYPSSSTRISISKELKRGDNVGAVNHQSIVTLGEGLYYVSAKGGIKSIALGTEQTDFDFEDVTEVIRPSIKNGVFTSCRSVYFEKEKVFLVAYKNSSDSTYNDRVIVVEHTLDTNGVLKYKAIGMMDWLVGDWFTYGEELYFGGSYEPNCFKAFDGYQKGGPDLPFTAMFTTKRFRFDSNPFTQKDIEYLMVDGWILPGTTLNFQLDYDYLGSRAHITGSLAGTETDYIIQPQINTIGAFEMGSEPIGGTLDDIDELNYFRIFFTLPQKHKPSDLQLTCYSSEAGSRWKINSLGFKVNQSNMVILKKNKKSLI